MEIRVVIAANRRGNCRFRKLTILSEEGKPYILSNHIVGIKWVATFSDCHSGHRH